MHPVSTGVFPVVIDESLGPASWSKVRQDHRGRRKVLEGFKVT